MPGIPDKNSKNKSKNSHKFKILTFVFLLLFLSLLIPQLKNYYKLYGIPYELLLEKSLEPTKLVSIEISFFGSLSISIALYLILSLLGKFERRKLFWSSVLLSIFTFLFLSSVIVELEGIKPFPDLVLRDVRTGKIVIDDGLECTKEIETGKNITCTINPDVINPQSYTELFFNNKTVKRIDGTSFISSNEITRVCFYVTGGDPKNRTPNLTVCYDYNFLTKDEIKNKQIEIYKHVLAILTLTIITIPHILKTYYELWNSKISDKDKEMNKNNNSEDHRNL